MSKCNISWQTILACLAVTGDLSAASAMGSYRSPHGSPHGFPYGQPYDATAPKTAKNHVKATVKSAIFSHLSKSHQGSMEKVLEDYKRQHGIFP